MIMMSFEMLTCLMLAVMVIFAHDRMPFSLARSVVFAVIGGSSLIHASRLFAKITGFDTFSLETATWARIILLFAVASLIYMIVEKKKEDHHAF